MITVTAQLQVGKQRFFIYENTNEFEATGLTEATWEDCKPGDYILTSNGYYVPIINRYEYEATHNVKMVKIVFPGHYWWNFLSFNTGRFQKKIMLYERDRIKTAYIPKHLNQKAKLLAVYLKAGMPLFEAAKRICHYETRSKIMGYADKLMQQPGFWDLFTNEDIKRMREEFAKIGLNKEYLARQLMNLIESPATKDNVKKDVIKLANDILDQEEKAEQEITKAAKKAGYTSPQIDPDYGAKLAELEEGDITNE